MLRRAFAFVAIAFALSIAVTDVGAAAQRTFVASQGDDANPCSLVLPCRSFATAIGQTISGGEVIVLDSAGYGVVTIDKSVSIVAPAGVYAGVSVLSGDGITINAVATDVVRLRGLRINGLGGVNGIVANTVGLLDIANVEVNGFTIHGLYFVAPDARLVVIDSSFTNNGSTGALVQSAAARSFATFLRSRFDHNALGVTISANAFGNISESSASYNTGGANMVVTQGGVANISDCTIAGLDTGASASGILVSDSIANVTRCKISGSANGFLALGTGAKAVVSDTTVVAGGGIVSSLGAIVTAERCTVNGNQHGFTVGVENSVLYVSNSTAVDNVVDAFYVYAPGSKIYTRQNNTVSGSAVSTGLGTFTTFGAN